MKAHTGSETLEAMLRRYCTEAAGQLQAVCLHALAGGSRTRANLLLAAAGRRDGLPIQAACALEMMHAATLLQDDIFDRSTERRGRRAAYLQFGEAQAVLASDWLLLRSLEVAAEVHPLFFQQLACAARNMAATVAKELDPPMVSGTSAAYLYIEEICQGKTASLFAVALHGAALLHPQIDRAHAPGWAAVGNRIGCTYQLLDDCLDVYAPEGTLNKSTGIDVQQGRLTLPLLTALQALQSAGQGISIDRFLKARLIAKEMALLERAIAEEAVRDCLEAEVRRQVRAIEEEARSVAIPCEPISAALNDMEAKIACCFGVSAKCMACEVVPYQPALAL